MHVLDKELEAFLNHSGVKGMRWGVRNEDKPSSKSKRKTSKSKLDNHPSLAEYGRQKIKDHRKYRTKFDIDHIDAETGEYSHQGKGYKAARAVSKALSIAGAVTSVGAALILSGS